MSFDDVRPGEGAALWGDSAPRTPGADEIERRRGSRTFSGGRRAATLFEDGATWTRTQVEGALRRGYNDFSVWRFEQFEDGGFHSGVLNRATANERYGIDGALTFDDNVTETYAAYRHERTQRELARAEVLQRSEGNVVGDLALAFAGGFFDPVNWLIPFARINALRTALPAVAALEASPRVLPRLLGGAAFGALEGAAFTTAIEPAIFGLARYNEIDDYGLDDSLLNLVIGAGFGGVIGAGGNVFFPNAEAIAAREALPERVRNASVETRAAALAHAVEAVAEGRPVRASEVYDATAPLEFETETGARYAVHDDASATRTGADGARSRSAETWYLTPEDASHLDNVLNEAGPARSVVSESGYLAVHVDEGPSTGELADLTPALDAPEPGLVPVSIERDGRVRFGSPITRVWGRGEQRPQRGVAGDDAAPVVDEPDFATPRELNAEQQRHVESRDVVKEQLAEGLRGRYGDDADAIAHVAANGLAAIGRHFGETAEDVAGAIKLAVADNGSAVGVGTRYQQAASAVPMLSKRQHQRRARAIKQADKEIAKAERQAVALLAAAECVAREGWGAAGHGTVELVGGLGIAAGAAIPVGMATAEAAKSGDPRFWTPQRWLDHVRAASGNAPAVLDSRRVASVEGGVTDFGPGFTPPDGSDPPLPDRDTRGTIDSTRAPEGFAERHYEQGVAISGRRGQEPASAEDATPPPESEEERTRTLIALFAPVLAAEDARAARARGERSEGGGW